MSEKIGKDRKDETKRVGGIARAGRKGRAGMSIGTLGDNGRTEHGGKPDTFDDRIESTGHKKPPERKKPTQRKNTEHKNTEHKNTEHKNTEVIKDNRIITAGIDLGSTYAKVVVMAGNEVAGYAISPTGADHEKTAKRTLRRACRLARIPPCDIDYAVSTGYGRRVVTFADENISEISANATGVEHIARTHDVRTIIDIGGQDTKVIALDDDLKMINFAMNDKCAAGTGRFLEILARVLEVPLDDMGELSLRSGEPVDITSTCLVFAKSEVASLIFKGKKKEDIIAGIHKAVARRLVSMAKKVGVRDSVFFDGGPARNIGMIKALERELGKKLVVPPMPQIVTATGAAIIARKRFPKGR